MNLHLLFVFFIKQLFHRGLSRSHDNEVISKGGLKIISWQIAKSPFANAEDPEVMCMEKSVGIAVTTKNPYFGRIFVNGLSDSTDCSKQFNTQDNRGKFVLQFGACDMRANRILSPHAGMEYTTTVVVSFHTELLTQTDRAFNIRCRYYQADQSIGSFFEVSVMPTVVLTNSFPTPSCRYTLHVNSIDGPEAQFTRIGDSVFHRWTCDSAMYGIKVRSCFVDDGRKRRYQLVDATGCASDLMILPDITYDVTLQAAYVQTNVFKFADRAHVFFQCQISLCLKDQQACYGITPPNCNKIRRSRRMARLNSNSTMSNHSEGELDHGVHSYMDIASPSMVVLDIGDERKFEAYVHSQATPSGYCDVCLATYSFAGLIACNVLTLIIATVTAIALCRRPTSLSLKS